VVALKVEIYNKMATIINSNSLNPSCEVKASTSNSGRKDCLGDIPWFGSRTTMEQSVPSLSY
jgi:hypothetical protein